MTKQDAIKHILREWSALQAAFGAGRERVECQRYAAEDQEVSRKFPTLPHLSDVAMKLMDISMRREFGGVGR